MEKEQNSGNSLNIQRINKEFNFNAFILKQKFAQFFLPMVFHRIIKNASMSAKIENLFRKLKFTDFLGSPVISRFDKKSLTN